MTSSRLLAIGIGALAIVTFASVQVARADHYGFWSSYYNTYIVGWNTETGFTAGQVFGGCDNVHWRHFAKLNIYGYQSYEDPYINWIQLYDGTTINSSIWIYGASYLFTNEDYIPIDSYADSFYSSHYYFTFAVIEGNGDVVLSVPKGADPDGACSATGHFLYERVG
ncbi:MAG: hypothetical protein C3F10_10560 [Dehalococcoidia bacterium]|nr:MAG: hypothetical protein C3F10_10560 [Dehalococcoidia bacterium]